MIDAETLPAIVAEVSFQAIARAFALRPETAAMRTGWMASCRVFFGVDMFNVGKVAL